MLLYNAKVSEAWRYHRIVFCFRRQIVSLIASSIASFVETTRKISPLTQTGVLHLNEPRHSLMYGNQL